ncbi:MAG: penicillin-binding protein 2 [Bacteroidetes bacterium]|nr:penicillin-binding protein 2 [Bacteroidota bacterium]
MDIFKQRKYFIQIIIILISIIYIIRLFALQVVDTSYKISASNNVLRHITQYPARGLVYDRNEELLVYNQAAYDLMIVPRQLEAFDTTDFCNIINISKQQLIKEINKAKKYSYFKPSLFLKQMSSVTYAKLQEKLYKYKGFFVQTRTLRKYTQKIAAHALGYVGEVDEEITKKKPYYKLGDYMGISGIEKSYEKELRGKKGVQIYLVDVHNRIKGNYKKGKYDTNAVAGANITTTLDANLQEYGEKLMQNKKGSIVAIEPSTGEILTMVTSPSYNPALLVGRIRTKNYLNLLKDTLKPLFNRAVMAKYPPGSTFKIITALVGLQEKVLYKNTLYSCHGGYHYGRQIVGCHNHPSPLDLTHAIQYSCNAYFCNVYRSIIDNPEFTSADEGFKVWRDYVTSFGLGNKLGTDFANELSGNIPTTKYYDKYYGHGHWSSLTTLSLSIGQGELGITPLQLANMTSTVANRGFYYTPHLIKKISSKKNIDEKFLVQRYTKIDSSYFPIVIDGMEKVINGEAGSTARIAKIKDIIVCGKTGTAQNPHGDNHSIFIAFAPKDNPKIAIAVFIENGGYGARWAAPTASLMIEKYLKKNISRKWLENYILNCDLINEQTQDKHME